MQIKYYISDQIIDNLAAIATCAPSCVNSKAIALPSPVPPPVINATLPLSAFVGNAGDLQTLNISLPLAHEPIAERSIHSLIIILPSPPIDKISKRNVSQSVNELYSLNTIQHS